MSKVLLTRLPIVGIAAFVAACTVHSTDTPGLTGPSEYALSVAIAATPDSLAQDGASQSAIVVTARNAQAHPVSGLAFRLEMQMNGRPVDYGSLSSRTVVTNSDGRATAMYTAPAPPPAGANIDTCAPSVFSPAAAGPCITISATPVSSGYASVVSQTVDIHLVPVGVIYTTAPTARFTFTPASPLAGTAVQFDASNSCPGPVSGSGCAASGTVISRYTWNFGDGTVTTTTSPVIGHTFTTAQTFSVTLTVTNDRGTAASSTQALTVGAGTPPTATIVFSPSAPRVGMAIQFNGERSIAAPGRTITQYLWNWGDGETATGALQDHDYAAVGSYNVVLTVVDDIGQRGTAQTTVTVGPAIP